MTGPAVRLTVIGYWAGPDTTGAWPSVTDFVDLAWDEDDRDFVATYLTQGRLARTYMGWSRCRVCGKNNGDSELTDGSYVWPTGLSHYVTEHGVRLPEAFVQHAYARTESLEQAERDLEWWRSATPTRAADGSAGVPVVRPEHPGAGNQTVLGSPTEPVADPTGPGGRDAVVAVLEELRRELEAGPQEEWENDTLDRFLEAFGELLAVIENSYVNTGREVPSDPWVLVADALRGARYYE